VKRSEFQETACVGGYVLEFGARKVEIDLEIDNVCSDAITPQLQEACTAAVCVLLCA
jgi:hypothetical protein